MAGNTSAKQAMIFDIQHFSVDDGPGIRTTVFFKGCSLRCLWCHNPESIEFSPQLMVYRDRCTACGACCIVCFSGARRIENGKLIFNRSSCTGCGSCVKACGYNAIKLCGRRMSVRDVLAEIAMDEVFCRGNGGVTFSGGEVMLQTSFLADLLNACKARGFHTVVDTAGNVPGAGFSEEILNGTDLFLFDIKAMSPELHKYCTGSENKLILQNIRSLSARGGAIWIRIPFIYGLTCSDEEIDMMSDFFLRLRGVERFELLAYHAYGESKYEALGKNCPYIPSENPPAEEMIGMVLARFAKKGINMECPALNKGR